MVERRVDDRSGRRPTQDEASREKAHKIAVAPPMTGHGCFARPRDANVQFFHWLRCSINATTGQSQCCCTRPHLMGGTPAHHRDSPATKYTIYHSLLYFRVFHDRPGWIFRLPCPAALLLGGKSLPLAGKRGRCVAEKPMDPTRGLFATQILRVTLIFPQWPTATYEVWLEGRLWGRAGGMWMAETVASKLGPRKSTSRSAINGSYSSVDCTVVNMTADG